MTLPKGFGGGSRFDPDSVISKQNRFPKREIPVRIKKKKTNYCDQCGHLKMNHQGFIIKGKCKICMCPMYRDQIIEVEDRK